VQARGKETDKAVTVEEWSRWDLGQRYALFKLSISKNEPEVFFAALKEFREGSGNPS